jgi:hypothetical protein
MSPLEEMTVKITKFGYTDRRMVFKIKFTTTIMLNSTMLRSDICSGMWNSFHFGNDLDTDTEG